MWKPFDLRFQKILGHIKIHQEIVRDELHFASTAASQSTIRQDISQLGQTQLQACTEEVDRMKETHDEMSKSSTPLPACGPCLRFG